uniref:Uncharacterized protein n=1 Tax=Arundo donax TaxID=35708 RepID=A0A0A8ZFL7_ARUDO
MVYMWGRPHLHGPLWSNNSNLYTIRKLISLQCS